jgi:hypothetical protein
MRKLPLVVTFLMASSLSSIAVSHHSFAEWNQDSATLTGTVKEFQWANPHTWIIALVLGADGKQVEWGFETASPLSLKRRGWKNTSFKPGDKITVTFHTNRHGGNTGNIMKVVLPDQTILTAEDIISIRPGEPPPPDSPPGKPPTDTSQK